MNKPVEFYKNKIIEQLGTVRKDIGNPRYNLYKSTVQGYDSLELLKSMCDNLQLQIEARQYYNEKIDSKLAIEGVNIKDISMIACEFSGESKMQKNVSKEEALTDETFEMLNMLDSSDGDMILEEIMGFTNSDVEEPINLDDEFLNKLICDNEIAVGSMDNMFSLDEDDEEDEDNLDAVNDTDAVNSYEEDIDDEESLGAVNDTDAVNSADEDIEEETENSLDDFAALLRGEIAKPEINFEEETLEYEDEEGNLEGEESNLEFEEDSLDDEEESLDDEESNLEFEESNLEFEEDGLEGIADNIDVIFDEQYVDEEIETALAETEEIDFEDEDTAFDDESSEDDIEFDEEFEEEEPEENTCGAEDLLFADDVDIEDDEDIITGRIEREFDKVENKFSAFDIDESRFSDVSFDDEFEDAVEEEEIAVEFEEEELEDDAEISVEDTVEEEEFIEELDVDFEEEEETSEIVTSGFDVDFDDEIDFEEERNLKESRHTSKPQFSADSGFGKDIFDKEEDLLGEAVKWADSEQVIKSKRANRAPVFNTSTDTGAKAQKTVDVIDGISDGIMDVAKKLANKFKANK